MNPRQRFGMLLVAMAAIGLILVFIIVAGIVADVRSEVNPKVSILRLRSDVAARQPFEDRSIVEVRVPERYVPPRALRDRSALAGLVAGVDLPRGSVLQQGMAVAPPELKHGEREIAILVDAETGVAGKVDSGNLVDIVATFEGDRSVSGRPQSRIIVSQARVIAVGQASTRRRAADSAQADPGQAIPVTFALSVTQALSITYAESFAQEVRLALLRPGDTERVPAAHRVFPRPVS
jgi:pilus assembly protein CpaB